MASQSDPSPGLPSSEGFLMNSTLYKYLLVNQLRIFLFDFVLLPLMQNRPTSREKYHKKKTKYATQYLHSFFKVGGTNI